MTALTPENYGSGLLVDEELMAGVTASPDQPGGFVAFVLNHVTGEYLGYRHFPDLDGAIAALAGIPREWKFEATGGCGAEGCAAGSRGKCAGDRCKRECPKKSCVSPEGSEPKRS